MYVDVPDNRGVEARRRTSMRYPENDHSRLRE
jgi:hypothetical protein